jgi:hypothetical protein
VSHLTGGRVPFNDRGRVLFVTANHNPAILLRKGRALYRPVKWLIIPLLRNPALLHHFRRSCLNLALIIRFSNICLDPLVNP